ncbi:MAG: hypothetical protein ACP6IY_08495 [Promethearchaeia archaeon]
MLRIIEYWRYQSNKPILGIEIGDINNSDKKQIIAYDRDGKILILDEDGSLLFEDFICRESAIWNAKIVNEGDSLLLTGGLDGLLRLFKIKRPYKLEPKWAHRFGGSIGGILIDYITNNKIKEILAYSLDKTLRILDLHTGNLIWGQIFEDGIGDAFIWKKKNNFEEKEIWACGNDATLRIFNGKDGELIHFKRFKNKVRCLTSFNLKGVDSKKPLIICGGDDAQLHVIDKNSFDEIKTLRFNNYVWKTKTFQDLLFVSTYSFEYFGISVPIEQLKFTSKLVCLNDKLEIIWELSNENIEFLDIFKTSLNEFQHILSLGTTKGDIILLNPFSGIKIGNITTKTCVNCLKFIFDKNLLISCHDDGSIRAFIIKQK